MVHINWALERSADVLAELDQATLGKLAGPAAMDRRARFRKSMDGDDYVAARVLTKLLLAQSWTGTTATEWQLTQTCTEPRCGRTDPHGKPSGLHKHGVAPVSWSHSSGLVACAVLGRSAPDHEGALPDLQGFTDGTIPTENRNIAATSGAFQIGIDAEPSTQEQPPVVSNWHAWTRAEALVKAGLMDLDEALSLDLGGPHRMQGFSLSALPDLTRFAGSERTTLWDLPVDDSGTTASVAVTSAPDSRDVTCQIGLSQRASLSQLMRHLQTNYVTDL